MVARALIYNLMIIGAMLLAGCSCDDDEALEASLGTPEAISFLPTLTPCPALYSEQGTLPYSLPYDDEEEGVTRAGQTGIINSEDLRTTGFGVFASLNASKTPDMMFNQEVSFTFVGDMDDPMKGYWSYQPIKYWPNGLTSESNFFISAYAPYQNQPIADPETTTGIYGLSENNESPYIDYRRCEKPEEVVDLLWFYEKPNSIPAAGTLAMKMHHALARLEINVKLAAEPAEGTKVLIDSISLTGEMAKTGRLSLSSQETETEVVDEKTVTRYYPVWSEQEYDKDDGDNPISHNFIIDNTDNNPQSYGIIDSQVRYIKGLPYDWQPEGLTTKPQNALSTGDRKTYVYLIPQESLTLTVLVRYHKMTTSTDDMKTTTAALTTVATPLKGNTTYSLNLTLSDIKN